MNFYKTYAELPKIIKEYANKHFDIITSYSLFDLDDGETNYCPNCYSVIQNDSLKCLNCNIDYSNKDWIPVDKRENHYEYIFNYLVIEADSDNVITYIISYSINYDKDYRRKEIVPSRFNAYKIDKNGTLNLSNNEYYYLFEKHLNRIEDDPSMIDINLVYKDNIENLNKNELYKYIDIEKYKAYLDNLYYYTFNSIILNPIRYKEFEYLLKMELYNLAKDGLKLLNKGKTFNEIFGVPKSYYNFMKEINIKPYEFVALRLYNTKDKGVLTFLSSLLKRRCYHSINNGAKELKWFFDLFKFDMEKLYEYVTKRNIDVIDYYDYMEWSKELGFNIKSSKIKYPNNFKEEHDKLCNQITIIDNKERNDHLIRIHNYLKINTYEDDKYIIFPAYDVASLVDESFQMNNCVRTYIKRIINHNCFIYFMREKENINKSLVTVEVVNGEVVQAKRKNNTSITKEDEIFLKKFEEQYILIDFDDT